MIGDYTLDQLISCDFGRWDVPFFDGDCWTYMNDYVTVQSVLDCMVWFDRGLTSTTITIVANDMAVDPSALELDTFSLVWTVLSIGQNFRHDLNSILKTNYFITDWYNNYEIQNHQALTFDGIDGVEIDLTGGDTVELGLVAPAAQYYTPGRCVDGSATNARRAGRLAGMATRVTISADVAWAAGNTVVLLFNGTDTIADVVLAWNTANPANTVTVTGGDDTQIPADQEYIQLHNGSDEVSCLPGEYYPFNRWLVLTRDCVTNQAQWIPPQCCLQTMNFVGGNITIDIDIAWPDISSINTDNQQLTLTSDALRPSANHHDTLCLSRRHGGALGVQIPDPDSCVDLRSINEHTLELQDNLLYILGSDGLVNNVVDLINVNEHTINLSTPETLNLIDSSWDVISSSDLTEVGNQILTLVNRMLCVIKENTPQNNCNSCAEDPCVDLSMLKYWCWNVLGCVCWTKIDRSALWVAPVDTPVVDPCTYWGLFPKPPLDPGRPALPAWVTPCADWWKWDLWNPALSYHRHSRVIHDDWAIDPWTWLPYWPRRRAALITTVAWDEPWTDPLSRRVISDSLRPSNVRAEFFSEERTIWEVLTFLRGRIWWVSLNPCWWAPITGCWCEPGNDWEDGLPWQNWTGWADGDPGPIGPAGPAGPAGQNGTNWIDWNDVEWLVPVITRQKYRARISLKDNRVGWSKHAHLSSDPGTIQDARWMIPTFDIGKWWESSTIKMVDTNWWYIDADATTLKIMNWGVLQYSLAIWTWYNVAPSANNPYTQTESEFAQWSVGDPTKCSLAIYIPKDWYYNIEMTWVSQADHNIHAFRMSTLVYRPSEIGTKKLQILMDSKYGWWWAGSGSLNNPIIPTTNQRQMNAQKILSLKKWDVLFVGMKIDPRTIWPKYSNQWPSWARDLLYNLNDESPAFGIHERTIYSACNGYTCLSLDNAGILSWNYNIAQWGWNVSNDELPWIPANLPNLSPHFFAPTITWAQHNGAQNYGLNMVYPGWWAAYDEYRRDDWVVILYGPSSWNQSDWSWSTFLTYEDWWAALSVHRVNSLQNDDLSNVEF